MLNESFSVIFKHCDDKDIWRQEVFIKIIFSRMPCMYVLVLLHSSNNSKLSDFWKIMFNPTSQDCNAPTYDHFNYDVSATLRDMNHKLCFFESVTEDFPGNWSFQCRHNSNIALVCMEDHGAIGHELRVSKKYNLHSVWKSPKMSHLNFPILAFSTNFSPIKTDLSGNTVWPQASGFQKLAKMDNFWHF